MNKRQLVDAAARQSSLTREQMREALDAILETIAETPVSYTHLTPPTIHSV